ncbi:MAG: hypothetical protein ABSE45_06420 [Candidatus Acidiferrales bacterium]|jgi:hypothetical protein
MIAALIYVGSLVALIQFFLYYCRSILASSRQIELSARVREAAGVQKDGVAADDFERFVELLRLCPGNRAYQADMRAVGSYYGLLDVLGRFSRTAIPALVAWTDSERQRCSYFAAVALDRRISSSLELFVQQANGRL